MICAPDPQALSCWARKTGGGVPSRMPSPVAISPAAYSSRWYDQHAAAPDGRRYEALDLRPSLSSRGGAR